ncbi:MAG TPA: hypothetical protein VJS20_10545, partial [Gemmatimonadales bacterium]|nr:hypothetical protein [Gemmatimonadales bacterium]
MRVRLPLVMIGGALVVAGCSDSGTGPNAAAPSVSQQEQSVTGIFKTRQAVAADWGLMAAKGGNGGAGKGGTGIQYHG